MKTPIVVLDGAVVAPSEAKISALDRGFLFGDGVFEVLGLYRGVPFSLESHLARLWRSARALGFGERLDETVVRASIARGFAALAEESSRPLRASLRIVLTRGTANPHALGLDPTPTPLVPTCVVLIAPYEPRAKVDEEGCAVITATFRASPVPGAKVLGYAASIVARAHAHQQGAAEALALDESDHVVEGASSNVLLVTNGRLVVPVGGSLEGITQGHVLACAADLGVPAEKRRVTRAELLAASEVFLTSSLREIWPVVTVDGAAIGSGKPGSITRGLTRAYKRELPPR